MDSLHSDLLDLICDFLPHRDCLALATTRKSLHDKITIIPLWKRCYQSEFTIILPKTSYYEAYKEVHKLMREYHSSLTKMDHQLIEEFCCRGYERLISYLFRNNLYNRNALIWLMAKYGHLDRCDYEMSDLYSSIHGTILRGDFEAYIRFQEQYPWIPTCSLSLYDAALHGHLAIVKHMLEHVQDLPNMVKIAIIGALEGDRHDLIAYLFTLPFAHVDGVFLSAAVNGNLPIVRMLLENHGATLIEMAFKLACHSGNLSVVHYLRDHLIMSGRDMAPIYRQAMQSLGESRCYIRRRRNQYHEIIDLLLANIPDPDVHVHNCIAVCAIVTNDLELYDRASKLGINLSLFRPAERNNYVPPFSYTVEAIDLLWRMIEDGYYTLEQEIRTLERQHGHHLIGLLRARSKQG